MTSPVLTGTATAHVHGTDLTVTFQSDQPFVLAGGPLLLTVVVDVAGDAPDGVLAVSADQSRRRIADLSFVGTVGDHVLRDPAAATPTIGGPVAAVPLAALPLRRDVVVNQYLDLSTLTRLLAPGATAVLRLACRYRLALGPDPSTALTDPTAQAEAETVLHVPVRRDDDALAATFDDLTRSATDPSGEGELARTTLAALRLAEYSPG